MTNSERLAGIVKDQASQSMRELLAYWTEFEPGEDEDGYDLTDAFESEEEAAHDVINDKDADKESRKSARAALTEMRRLLIAAGYYREMTQREIDNSYSSRGTVWDFKLGGKAYSMFHAGSFRAWMAKDVDALVS